MQLFRFVDVLPYLNTSGILLRHIRSIRLQRLEVPSVLRWGAGKAGLGGALTAKSWAGYPFPTSSMGRQFIIGQNVKEAMGGLANCARTASPLPSTCSAKPRSAGEKATPMVTMRYWTRGGGAEEMARPVWERA